MSEGRPLIEDERFRERVAEIEVELKALEITQMRLIAEIGERDDGKPDPKSSILKMKGSQLQQAAAELLLEVARLRGDGVRPGVRGRGCAARPAKRTGR